MKAKIKAVSMTLKVALLGMMAFAFSACGEGKEAWEFTDLSKSEFEALKSDCVKNRKESACAKLNEIYDSEDFCNKLLSEKINENNYGLAGKCYYKGWENNVYLRGWDNNSSIKEALNQAIKYYEKACERKSAPYCVLAADAYENIFDTYDLSKNNKNKYSVKERASAAIKGAELYDKACDLGLNLHYACERGIKYIKENLPEFKEKCNSTQDEALKLACDFMLKKLQ